MSQSSIVNNKPCWLFPKHAVRGSLKSLLVGLCNILFLLVIVSLSLALPTSVSAQTVKIGVLAYKGKDVALKMWKPTGTYLQKSIPESSFEIIPLTFDEIDKAVQNNTVDFIIANSSIYVEIEAKYGVTRIATMKNRGFKGSSTVFGGTIKLEGVEVVDFKAGWEAKVRLRWRCLAPPGKDYQVFVHLVDEANRLHGQHDGGPNGGKAPTSLWKAGDVIQDEHVIRVPADYAGKELQLRLGLYNLAEGKRLTSTAGDNLLLMRARVAGPDAP